VFNASPVSSLSEIRSGCKVGHQPHLLGQLKEGSQTRCNALRCRVQKRLSWKTSESIGTSGIPAVPLASILPTDQRIPAGADLFALLVGITSSKATARLSSD
jgi:hypothetical protein